MDQNQIELVTILRDHGIGYEKIATMLEVSTITVRRACACLLVFVICALSSSCEGSSPESSRSTH